MHEIYNTDTEILVHGGLINKVSPIAWASSRRCIISRTGRAVARWYSTIWTTRWHCTWTTRAPGRRVSALTLSSRRKCGSIWSHSAAKTWRCATIGRCSSLAPRRHSRSHSSTWRSSIKEQARTTYDEKGGSTEWIETQPIGTHEWTTLNNMSHPWGCWASATPYQVYTSRRQAANQMTLYRPWPADPTLWPRTRL